MSKSAKSQLSIAESLLNFKSHKDPIKVTLSNELVNLLSDQLYQSPLKAIEELVVNSYDAEANECRIFVPASSDVSNDFVMAFDNGIGMDYEGLVDLWQIGRSKKRTAEIEKRQSRKQIGKFGIGKLAAKTIANKITYISRSKEGILSVTINFDDFSDAPTGDVKQVTTNVYKIDDWESFIKSTIFQNIFSLSCIDPNTITPDKKSTWTIVLLENLTDKARKIRLEALRWVLRTAMPLQTDFRLFLNCEEIKSSKEEHEKVVEFDLRDFPTERVKSLEKSTGSKWKKYKEGLISDRFPSGVSGNIFVTRKTLSGGKSDDIIRSNGFFIRVRNRLVNDNDPLFGLTPLFFGTFSRFRADIRADDLDIGLKASRETVEESTSKSDFRALLREIFNEANTKYESKMAEEEEERNPKREGERNQISSRLVEYPVADVIVGHPGRVNGAEADSSWFYINIEPQEDLNDLVRSLYTIQRNKYQYKYTKQGKSDRVVKFDIKYSTFWINEDHEFVAEYLQDNTTRDMLHDVLTAEALLEIYLRQNQVPLNIIGKVLEQRDQLLRSLARDRSSSLQTISNRLKDSAADEYELEISLVVAMRSLGFVAKHIAGAGNPDGMAHFNDYADGPKRIILEAKSSGSTPSLNAIDFAGLKEHMTKQKETIHGCLLIAPSYPGQGKDSSAVATRANELHVSCWTIDQIAHFVSVAEKRQLNARHVLDIVLKCFAPQDVTFAIDQLLAEPPWDQQSLYIAILKSLKQLEGRLQDTPRTIDMIAAEVSRENEFSNIRREDIEKATGKLAAASQGGMTVRDNVVILQVSQSELERRLSGITKNPSEPRRLSSFRKNDQA